MVYKSGNDAGSRIDGLVRKWKRGRVEDIVQQRRLAIRRHVRGTTAGAVMIRSKHPGHARTIPKTQGGQAESSIVK